MQCVKLFNLGRIEEKYYNYMAYSEHQTFSSRVYERPEGLALCGFKIRYGEPQFHQFYDSIRFVYE